MAVRQFDFFFIPNGAPPPNTSEESRDAPGIPLARTRQIQEVLVHYLGPPWMMLDDWVVFGPQEGNRVDVQFDDELLMASIFVRCDLRDDAPQFMTLIVDLACKFECKFFFFFCADKAN